MSKTVKMQSDKFKEIIQKQNEPIRPPTLGESAISTDWLLHIHAKHGIINYSNVKTVGIDPVTKKEKKEVYINTPNPGMEFIALREDVNKFYIIWILCVQIKTGRILYKINSGDIDFITWDTDSNIVNNAVMPNLTK